MKQTAVEWLEGQLLNLISFDTVELRNEFREKILTAKAIEEKLTIDTYLTGLNNCYFNYNLTNEQKHNLKNN